MRRWTIVAIGLGVSLAFGPSGRLWAQQDSELIEQSPFVVEEEAGFAVARPIDDGSAALAPGDCDGECLAGCPACCGTCACHSGHCCLGLTCSPCNMLPHYPYFPAMHGYYYFRPYHHSHVAQQQLTVTAWGGDPRNPYANRIFEQVYAQYEADQAAALPAPEPLSPDP